MRYMTNLMVVTFSTVVLGLAVAEAQYRMLVNHGAGWTAGENFATLQECSQDAERYAARYPARAGCIEETRLRAWEAEQAQHLAAQGQAAQQYGDSQFQEAAKECARRTRLQIIPKPGGKVTTFGTDQARFRWEKCMAEKGQPTE